MSGPDSSHPAGAVDVFDMFSQHYSYFDSQLGRDGVIRLQGGQWVGDECVFEFSVPTRGLAGVVRADWRRAEPEFELTDGAIDDPQTQSVLTQVRQLLPGFHDGAFDDLTAADFERMYSADYHTDQNYAVDSEFERERKGVMAELTIQLTTPSKVLVAGCSAGECLRQLRQRGVEAHGFDLCAQAREVAYPEVRDFVRPGSVTDIPFAPEEGFDTLTAFDVFEHIPAIAVPDMVGEFRRLGIRSIVALIAHCEYGYTGHVTLRPLSWWDDQLAPWFHRVPNHQLANPWPAVEPGNPDPTKLLRVYRAV